MEQKSFLVSARKYRPQRWETVVGQESVTSTLKKSVATGEIAQAYLFCGPRGVGKTSCARIFARAINEEKSETENTSELDIVDGDEENDWSFNVFELDAASNNKVDDIRSLTEKVRIPPQVGKYKVYIIDEVHMLTKAAFNAFLKTLEEPPAHAIFILATTEKHQVIPTILSRCQIFDFQRISIPEMVEHLKRIAADKQIPVEEEALHVIAQKADGAMRDALSIFDQVVAFSDGNLTYDSVTRNLNVLGHELYFKLIDLVLAEDIPGCLIELNEVVRKGFDLHHFVTGLGQHIRNLMVAKHPETVSILEVSDAVREQYKKQAESCDNVLIKNALHEINETDGQFKFSHNPRLLVELALMKLCSLTGRIREKKKAALA